MKWTPSKTKYKDKTLYNKKLISTEHVAVIFIYKDLDTELNQTDKVLSLWLRGKVETSDITLTKAKIYKHSNIVEGEFEIGNSMVVSKNVKRATHEDIKKEYKESQLKRKVRKKQG